MLKPVSPYRALEDLGKLEPAEEVNTRIKEPSQEVEARGSSHGLLCGARRVPRVQSW